MTESSEGETLARDFYGQFGARYNAQTKQIKEKVAYPTIVRLLECVFSGSISGRSMLDVGAGSGGLVRLLLDKGAQAFGVDDTPQQVKAAMDEGIRVHPDSMFHLPFLAQSLDAVVSFHSLNYAPHELQLGAINEQSRLLRQGGWVVLGCMHTDARTKIQIPMFGSQTPPLYLTPATDLEHLFTHAGLSGFRYRPYRCRASLLKQLALDPNPDVRELALLLRGQDRVYAGIAMAMKP